MKNGSELLIHVGLNTSGITDSRLLCQVTQGDVVKKGQTLITFDRSALKQEGFDTTCIIVNTKGSIEHSTKKQRIVEKDIVFYC